MLCRRVSCCATFWISPNEKLITGNVTLWTQTSANLTQRSVAYGSTSLELGDQHQWSLWINTTGAWGSTSLELVDQHHWSLGINIPGACGWTSLELVDKHHWSLGINITGACGQNITGAWESTSLELVDQHHWSLGINIPGACELTSLKLMDKHYREFWCLEQNFKLIN